MIKLLIIEDNPADARLISIHLQGINQFTFEITVATALQRAAEVISKQVFDIILLDLGLPDSKGVSSVEYISYISPRSLTIVMTGVFDANISSEAMSLGAQDFLIKGDCNSEILERTISNALNRNIIKQESDKNRKRLEAIIETANDAIITTDHDFIIRSWNRAAKKIFGYNRYDVENKSIFILFDDKEQESLREKLNDIYQTEDLTTSHLQELTAKNSMGLKFQAEVSVASWVSDNSDNHSLVVRDITERRKLEKMKSEFISTISHELRTPLTALLGSLKLVLGGVTGEISEKSSEFLTIAKSNGERLLLLINDILDMSKLEEGQMEFNLEPISVSEIIGEALIENENYANQHNVKFEITHTVEDAYINVDRFRMLQILANLLSNAAKYSPSDDVISIGVTKRDQFIKISISDKGPGIPESFYEHMFKKFSQSDSSTTRKVGGTGLGLHISKTIVEMMDGNIGFSSKPDVETIFYVEFLALNE